MPTAPVPTVYTAQGSATCSSSDQVCISTTVYTQCEGPIITVRGPSEASTISSLPAITGRAAQHGSDGHTISSFAPVSSPDRSIVPDTNYKYPLAEFSHVSTVLCPRQLDDNGCEYFLSCAICATVTEVPCLQASIQAITGAISGTDVVAQVSEDGTLVCEAEINCAIWDDDCSGVIGYDCGNNNSMDWKWNLIQYYSAKYDTMYPLYLDRTVTDDTVLCSESSPSFPLWCRLSQEFPSLS